MKDYGFCHKRVKYSGRLTLATVRRTDFREASRSGENRVLLGWPSRTGAGGLGWGEATRVVGIQAATDQRRSKCGIWISNKHQEGPSCGRASLGSTARSGAVNSWTMNPKAQGMGREGGGREAAHRPGVRRRSFGASFVSPKSLDKASTTPPAPSAQSVFKCQNVIATFIS